MINKYAYKIALWTIRKKTSPEGPIVFFVIFVVSLFHYLSSGYDPSYLLSIAMLVALFESLLRHGYYQIVKEKELEIDKLRKIINS